ncbi:hypothetical protein AC74_0940 [Escherichia coli 2-460-02_S4_C1]|nr:hypothetical protein AD02_2622 [Escherichia coli 2-460-02_S4_C2]KEJ53116.1 hypothetical protein AC74_0940 [Escherichia coli 2-460-02_S4_C1]
MQSDFRRWHTSIFLLWRKNIRFNKKVEAYELSRTRTVFAGI